MSQLKRRMHRLHATVPHLYRAAAALSECVKVVVRDLGRRFTFSSAVSLSGQAVSMFVCEG